MQVILISGKAGSGKDTYANMLKKHILKENPDTKVAIFHFADLLKMLCKQIYGWNGVKDESGRTLLQTTGDKIRLADQNYFVGFVTNLFCRILKDEFEYVIIPDLRYKNEYTSFSNMCSFKPDKLWHIHIKRNQRSNNMTDEQQHHPSEDMEQLLKEINTDFIVDDCTIGQMERSSRIVLDFAKLAVPGYGTLAIFGPNEIIGEVTKLEGNNVSITYADGDEKILDVPLINRPELERLMTLMDGHGYYNNITVGNYGTSVPYEQPYITVNLNGTVSTVTYDALADAGGNNNTWVDAWVNTWGGTTTTNGSY